MNSLIDSDATMAAAAEEIERRIAAEPENLNQGRSVDRPPRQEERSGRAAKDGSAPTELEIRHGLERVLDRADGESAEPAPRRRREVSEQAAVAAPAEQAHAKATATPENYGAPENPADIEQQMQQLEFQYQAVAQRDPAAAQVLHPQYLDAALQLRAKHRHAGMVGPVMERYGIDLTDAAQSAELSERVADALLERGYNFAAIKSMTARDALAAVDLVMAGQPRRETIKQQVPTKKWNALDRKVARLRNTGSQDDFAAVIEHML